MKRQRGPQDRRAAVDFSSGKMRSADDKQVNGLSRSDAERSPVATVVAGRQRAGRMMDSLRWCWVQHGYLSLLLVALTLMAYWPALSGQFVWDDNTYVTDNLSLHSLKGLAQIWLVPGTTPQYYPLSFTSFWVDYHLWGLNPLGYHLTNVLLQGINAVLLWTVLRRLAVPGAWLAAAMFAVHPVNVESVAWITERKNVLAGFFYLSSALFCLRFWLPTATAAGRRAPSGPQTPAAGPGNWKFYWLALLLYLGALLAKTATIGLPVAVGVVVWWKRGKPGWRELLPLAPFLGVGMVMGLFTVWVEKHLVHAAGSQWLFSFPERCLIAGRAVWFYLGKLAWPHPLMFVYPRWGIHALEPLAYVPVLALMVVLWILWLNRKGRARPGLVALAYFLALLFPVLGFFDVYFFRYSFVADHFQYLASIGPVTLAAAGMVLAFKRQPFLGRACGGAWLLTLGLLTWQQAGIYRDLETLWHDTLAKNPDCWMAHNNLGAYLYKKGSMEEAMEHYLKSIKIYPNDSEAWSNLGVVLFDKGLVKEAIEDYSKAIEIDLNNHLAENNLGVALVAKGQINEGIMHYRRALEIKPNYCDALDNLGVALAAKGRYEEAVESFRQAIRIKPDRAETFLHLGTTLEQLGRTREAVAQYREALRLNPDLIGALNNLAWVLAANPDAGVRNGAEAVSLAERACQLTRHKEPLLIGTLAAAYAEAGRYDDAVAAAGQARSVALAQGQTEIAARNEQLLDLYKSGRAYHQEAKPSP